MANVEIWIHPHGKIEMVSSPDGDIDMDKVKKAGSGLITIFTESGGFSSATIWQSAGAVWNAYNGPYPEELKPMMLLAGLPNLHRRYREKTSD